MKLAWLALALVLQPQDEKPTLQWNLAAGQAVRYEFNVTLTSTAFERTTTTDAMLGLALTVSEVKAGVATLQATFDHLKMSIKGEYSYDTAVDKEAPNRLCRTLKGIVGKAFTLKLTKRGEVSVEGLAEVIAKTGEKLSHKDWFQGDGLKRIFQFGFGVLPAEPAAVGTSWEVKSDFPLIVGGLDLKQTCKLKELRESGIEAVLEKKIAITPGKGLDLEGVTLKEAGGTAERVWQCHLGMLKSAQLRFKVVGVPKDDEEGGFEGSARVDVKLAPKK